MAIWTTSLIPIVPCSSSFCIQLVWLKMLFIALTYSELLKGYNVSLISSLADPLPLLFGFHLSNLSHPSLRPSSYLAKLPRLKPLPFRLSPTGDSKPVRDWCEVNGFAFLPMSTGWSDFNPEAWNYHPTTSFLLWPPPTILSLVSSNTTWSGEKWSEIYRGFFDRHTVSGSETARLRARL